MHIRNASLSEVPAMIDLAMANPTAAQWSRAQYERLFVRNLTELAENQGELSEDLVLVAAHDEIGAPRLIGFLVAHRVGRDWELQNIAVSKVLQRHGIGASLLSEFIAHARRENHTEIFLEVRESNRNARALYQNAGFKEAGVRKDYYSNPIEKAVLYCLAL
jgi:ribosomal-protein-alanine acetyltransferase